MRNFKLRDFQLQSIHALRSRRHILCIAPTGSGKSLIYETEILHRGLKTLIITPLTALARQQESKISALGISVINGCAYSGSEIHRIVNTMKPQVLLLSPEKLVPHFEMIRRFAPQFCVIDECHCISEWGNTFRPSYKQIPSLLKTLGPLQTLWLTATINTRARHSIEAGFGSFITVLGDVTLPKSISIYKHALDWSDRMDFLLCFLSGQSKSGLLFVNTRSMAERLSKLLRDSGAVSNHEVICYHAGLSQEEKNRIYTDLANSDRTRIIVATSAFGLGVDISNLHWVLVWQVPYSVSNLIQFIGRTGRSGLKGVAHLLWNTQDIENIAIEDTERRALSSFYNNSGCSKKWVSNYYQGTEIL
jgi:ATP-dependent DNA helicase RecQ